MNDSFQPDDLPAYEERRRHHIEWMREWTLDRMIETPEESGGVDEAGSPPVSGPPRPAVFRSPAFDDAESDLEAGRVRLLAPGVCGARPLHVLLLGEWAEGLHWFAPFSPWSLPATNWELASGMAANPLRTLQVWNIRSAPISVLRRGWTADTAPPGLVGDVKALYRAFADGGKTPPALAPRTGTRILSPTDSRTEYIKNETALLDQTSLTWIVETGKQSESATENAPSLFDKLAGGIDKLFRDIVDEILVVLKPEAPVLALAAAGGAEERELQFRTLAIEDSEILVHLSELQQFPGGFVIYTENDRDGLLEGAEVLDATGAVVATIRNGAAGGDETPLRLLENGEIKFAVRLENGNFARLREIHDDDAES